MSAHNLAAQTDFNIFSAGEQDDFPAGHDFAERGQLLPRPSLKQ
jgi:hypothetical protein